MTKKVAFLDTVHEVLQQGLEKAGWICDDLTTQPKEDVEKIIQHYQGIVIRSRFPMNADFLSKATALEFIARSGAGMENIEVPYCNQRGIQLFNAPEGNRNAVAEHALGMLLSLLNHLNRCDAEVRNGIWRREENKGTELDGKTVGIIGYGNNGEAFAKKLRGFDVRVLVYDKYKTGFGNGQVEETDWETICREADVLSLHIPQNTETIGLVNDERINRFSKSFYLINLSRGKIVDTAAVMRGIEAGKIAGACLDVLEYEKSSFENMFDIPGGRPEAFEYILKSDKVLLSPHVGGWTHESYYKLSKVLLDKISEHYHL
ncbi:MAG: phosphoglycerate dehydrogenase [Bacteroidetes bacterium]|nr:phosphoglycerate dehydrogenase [Bacteroidota bacterium]